MAELIADDGAPLKIYAIEQRPAAVGEPRCVVCGRYGEYISDATDADVCSLECKRADMAAVTVSPVAQTSFRYAAAAAVRDASADFISFVRRTFQIAVCHGAERPLPAAAIEPRPFWDFDQLALPDFLAGNLARAGITSPTPIQMQVIPAILYGLDVIASAAAGSGKTLAFALALVARLSAEPIDVRQAVRVVVLAPTRELCVYLEQQFQALMRGFPVMRTASLIGGVPLPNQLHRLRERRPQVVCCTPGRLLAILSRDDGTIDASQIAAVVVDEMDELLSRGFERELRGIMRRLPRDTQRLFFSATISDDAARAAAEMAAGRAAPAAGPQLVRIAIGLPSGDDRAASVRHTLLWTKELSKRDRLVELLGDKRYFQPPTVIFVNSKAGAGLLAEAITALTGIACTHLHADRPQSERLAALADFCEGRVPVMVATAVLARGVHLGGIVRQVINFDMAASVHDYEHQVGRAGRGGSKGWALTFINDESKHLFYDLAAYLRAQADVTPLPADFLQSPFTRYKR